MLKNFISRVILRITCLIFSIIWVSQWLSYCSTDTQSAHEMLSFAAEGSELPWLSKEAPIASPSIFENFIALDYSPNILLNFQ
jgi:hypothetical protein